MRKVDALLADARVFAGMRRDQVEFLAGCAWHVVFRADEVIFREGDAAETLYVVRHGTVAIEMFVPARGLVTIETVGAGGIVGWSWLFPPYRLHFDARASSLVRATAIDGSCLREKCAKDPALGYVLMSRLAQALIERLQATRLRLLDVYRNPAQGHGELDYHQADGGSPDLGYDHVDAGQR
jgi:CRP-like cAMP-binding protein